jgi:hypothetical protein
VCAPDGSHGTIAKAVAAAGLLDELHALVTGAAGPGLGEPARRSLADGEPVPTNGDPR